ncbi:MAG TPA: RNA methyltransferase [Opitutaceae bacterium]|nr:RNA methyltransferase [Opitutaceae bacterium]
MTAPRGGALTKAEVARLRSLREKRGREELGLFVVEGEKVVGELLAAGHPLEALYATEAWTGPRTVAVTAEEMARISHFPTPSSVLALARLRRAPLPPGALDRGLTLALDGVQDPGNVGTLWRVADWFALARLVLSPDCADPFSPKVIHASMGSFARVPLHVAPLAEALAATRAPVLGCDLGGADIHGIPPPRDAVIVIGSEGRGLSPEVAGRVTQRVTIPGHGRAESLNAAIAAAIVCDNLRRPR